MAEEVPRRPQRITFMELNFIKTFTHKLKDLISSNTEEGASFFKTCFNGLNALTGYLSNLYINAYGFVFSKKNEYGFVVSFIRLVASCLNIYGDMGLYGFTGIGLITIPYTLAQAGWLSLAFLIIMAMVFCYTGLLLQRCVDSNPSIKTYSDIGSYAFGRRGRILISIFQFVEVYLVPTGFLILEGDNLHKLFPHVGFKAHGHTVEGKKFFTIISGLVILPTMWLKDFNMLSYVSATGVLSSVIIIFSILWVGAVDGIGFSNKGKLFDIGGVPTTLGLYAFCFGAHPIFPNLYSSMKDKNRFSQVLILCFALTALSYISMAAIGYLMFGENVQSQVTLSLPTRKVSSQIAIYTILVAPITKFALIFSPIPTAIENQLPRKYKTKFISILLRTGLLISTLGVALGFPFFTLLVALIGSILIVTVSILLPCSLILKISGVYWKWTFEAVMIWFIILFWFSGRSGGYILIHKRYS